MSTIGARVPDDLIDEIDRYADANGIDRSTAIEELLRQGLGEEPPDRPLPARVERLERRVDRIERRPWNRLF